MQRGPCSTPIVTCYYGLALSFTHAGDDTVVDPTSLLRHVERFSVVSLRKFVPASPRTLDHVESISSDVSVLARDSGVQRNLKQLVTALSRLLDD